MTEEDLTQLFGKAIIDNKFARTFKTIVNQASGLWKNLAESISLQMGAGPTVRAAFAENNLSGHLPMFVQCPFLCSLHSDDSLAAAIVAHYQRLEKSRLDEGFQYYPDQERIRCVLVACQEQTTAFPWKQRLYDVAARLEYVVYHDGEDYPDGHYAMHPIEPAVF